MDNNLLIAKIEDKIKQTKTKNKTTNSDFLNEQQIAIIEKELSIRKEKNYFFYGGYEDALRKVIFFYPEKITKSNVEKNIDNIIGLIKISVPNEIIGKLKHKDYLGTIMSFGLTRERIGDIIVFEDKAYIIALKENCEYIKEELKQEKRFKKAKIEILKMEKVETKPIKFEEIAITVNSIRLDNIVAELLNTSRNIAQKKIEEEKVFVNYLIEKWIKAQED